MVIHFYGPQRSWGKVIFLQACVILFTGGGGSASVHVGIPPPPSTAYWEIRSTSGRYASYWNAILVALILRSDTTSGSEGSTLGPPDLGSHQKFIHFFLANNWSLDSSDKSRRRGNTGKVWEFLRGKNWEAYLYLWGDLRYEWNERSFHCE